MQRIKISQSKENKADYTRLNKSVYIKIYKNYPETESAQKKKL